MSVETDLHALLAGQCPRVFPDDAAFATPLPFVTYQQIGGEALAHTDNTLPGAKNGYFQINVWAASRIEAAALALAIEDAMIGAVVFQARPMAGPIARREPELARYGTQQDFTIWSVR